MVKFRYPYDCIHSRVDSYRHILQRKLDPCSGVHLLSITETKLNLKILNENQQSHTHCSIWALKSMRYAFRSNLVSTVCFYVFTDEGFSNVHDISHDIFRELRSCLQSTDVSKHYTHKRINTTAISHDLWVDWHWRSSPTRFNS